MNSGEPRVKSGLQTDILRHIGRYRLSFRPLLEREFFNGCQKSCDNTLLALKKNDLVQSHTKSLGRFSSYQLTQSGTEAVSVPKSRSKPFGSSALVRHLSIAWFCFYGRHNRVRAEQRELAHASLFGADVEGDYCIQPRGKTFAQGKVLPVIYQIQILGPRGRVDHMIRRIETFLPIIQSTPSLKNFLDLKLIGFAVLGFHDDDLRETRRRIRRTPWSQKFLFEYALVPRPDNFEAFCKKVNENAE